MLASLLTIAVLHGAVLLIPGFNFVLIGQLAAGGSRAAALSAVAVLLVFATSVVWHASLALLLSRPRVQSACLRRHQALNRVTGAVVGVYGARLIASAVTEWRSRATELRRPRAPARAGHWGVASLERTPLSGSPGEALRR